MTTSSPEINKEGKRVIASMGLEAEGLKEYPDPSICSYIFYLCQYCTKEK